FIPWFWENFPVGMWCSSGWSARPYGEGHAAPRTCGPQSSGANPLDYAFWLHIESKAFTLCHTNIAALKAAVNQEWPACTRTS
ncbi:Uncharacterized protein FKW44_002306, partial [Caligus rogercresseyi]